MMGATTPTAAAEIATPRTPRIPNQPVARSKGNQFAVADLAARAVRADARGRPRQHHHLHDRPAGLVGGPDLDEKIDMTD